jgi:hypothetical protein
VFVSAVIPDAAPTALCERRVACVPIVVGRSRRDIAFVARAGRLASSLFVKQRVLVRVLLQPPAHHRLYPITAPAFLLQITRSRVVSFCVATDTKTVRRKMFELLKSSLGVVDWVQKVLSTFAIVSVPQTSFSLACVCIPRCFWYRFDLTSG